MLNERCDTQDRTFSELRTGIDNARQSLNGNT